MTVDDLAKIIERVRSGDGEALAELVASCQDRLLPRVRRLMSPDLRVLAETQGVLDSVFMHAPELFKDFEYKGEEALLQYLAKVAAYKISDRRDHLNAVKRGGGKQLAPGTVAEDLLAAKSAGGPSPSEQLAAKEVEARLQQALTHLNPEQREAIVLRYFEKLTLREVGNRFGISEDAARMRVARAEMALAGFYNQQGWSKT